MASLLSAKNNGAKTQLAPPSKVAHSTIAYFCFNPCSHGFDFQPALLDENLPCRCQLGQFLLEEKFWMRLLCNIGKSPLFYLFSAYLNCLYIYIYIDENQVENDWNLSYLYKTYSHIIYHSGENCRD
jgi:hypothetical protein